VEVLTHHMQRFAAGPDHTRPEFFQGILGNSRNAQHSGSLGHSIGSLGTLREVCHLFSVFRRSYRLFPACVWAFY